jgi:hypothetical protein
MYTPNPYVDFFKAEYGDEWLHEYNRFLIASPSIIVLEEADCEKASVWIDTKLSSSIHNKRIIQFGENNPYESITYFLKNGILIHLHCFVEIVFLNEVQLKEAKQLAKQINRVSQLRDKQ